MTKARDKDGLTCFQLTLAKNAGWLNVKAPNLKVVAEALAGVAELIGKIDEIDCDNSGPTDVYYLGEPGYRSTLAEVVQKLTAKRSLWWIADNPKEAEEWAADLTSKGATMVEVKPVSSKKPEGSISVVFAIDPDQADVFFGSIEAIEPETYLDENLVRL